MHRFDLRIFQTIFRLGFIIFPLLVIDACIWKKSDLTMEKVSELGYSRIHDSAIVDLLRDAKGLYIELRFEEYEDSTLSRLEKGIIDLAIIPNNTEIPDSIRDIRTLVPLLPRILIILHRPDIPLTERLSSLMNGRTVGFEVMDKTDSLFFHELFDRYGISPDSFSSRLISDEDPFSQIDGIDVFITLTHLNNTFVRDLLDSGAFIYSLGDPLLYRRGSAVDGFCLNYPKAFPYILPKHVYKGLPEEPVLTIAIQDILVARKSLDDELVYDIVETLIEKKASLTQKDRMYGLLDYDYTSSAISFPVHQGAQKYLEKDKPTLIERYAELFGVIFSVLVVLIGGVSSFRQRMKHIKKDRIDTYYKKILAIRAKAIDNPDKKSTLIDELNTIRHEAFALIARIFL
jgi:TRAP-type uncharacterized transport system substrate-binding protein